MSGENFTWLGVAICFTLICVLGRSCIIQTDEIGAEVLKDCLKTSRSGLECRVLLKGQP